MTPASTVIGAQAAADANAPECLPLHGITCPLPGQGQARDHAERLLRSLGARVQRCSGPVDAHPAIAWACSGAMALTGAADGPSLMCPVPLASCLEGALVALRSLAGNDLIRELPDAGLLGERAAITGLHRAGRISPGGACRLLPAADGWLALSLARDHDWEMLPAWLEMSPDRSWHAVAQAVAKRDISTLLERGRLLGLALAPDEVPGTDPAPWCRVRNQGTARHRGGATPLVIDLSGLWAGPLCGQLLQSLGARVIKVESRQRPDGSRSGPAHFLDLMNAGKASVALDFADRTDLDRLRRLLRQADIVIEASRPRALRQLGIDAETLLDETPGLTWVSITGHGRAEPEADWIAYGDDAGVAAGLASLLFEVTGQPLFCADAVADPLTGVHAALAAWSGWRGGGGRLFALALSEVVRHCVRASRPECGEDPHARWQAWQELAVASGLAETRAPIRPAQGRARPLGADTVAVLSEFGIPC